jgi:hypothetical protein
MDHGAEGPLYPREEYVKVEHDAGETVLGMHDITERFSRFTGGV